MKHLKIVCVGRGDEGWFVCGVVCDEPVLGFGCVPWNSCVFKAPVLRVRRFGGDWGTVVGVVVLKEHSGSLALSPSD